VIERTVAIRQLARDIAQCSELKNVSLDSGHPCQTVAYESCAGDFRQLPEAWVGNLETARLMILSSNPTISVEKNPKKQELFPLGGTSNPEIEHPEWPIDRVLDFRLNRFEQRRETPYVLSDTRYLTVAGSHVASTNKYWTQSFRIGREIFGNEFQMERDIILTEVVHCKSKKEIGVKEAVATCSKRYLNRLLGLTMAQLVVIAGAQARARVHELRQMKADVVWDMTDDFGFLPTTKAGLEDLKAVDRRKHLGIIRCGQRHLPIVALQQLSMGSNPCRTLTALLGVTGANQLSDVVLGKTSLDLSSMNSSEFANFVLS